MSLLLTGSSGFLGKYLLKVIIAKGDQFKLLNRRPLASVALDKQILFDDFRSISRSDNIFSGVDVVVHCAARVHVMNDSSSNPLEEFREVNTCGTLNLAQQAADAGVKRFIFISSIKVNGESTELGFPFKPDDMIVPLDPYGLSKYEAEIGLKKITAKTSMEVVIIRPPLVYGPGVKANFNSLMKLANTGLLLPFGAVHNARSMVYVGNLVDFVVQCIDHPAVANQVFLISDGRDLSLTELLRLLRFAMVKSVRLVPVPALLFRLAGLLTGKRAVVDRLVGSLQVDSSNARELLSWEPPYTVEQGIKATVDEFLKSKK